MSQVDLSTVKIIADLHKKDKSLISFNLIFNGFTVFSRDARLFELIKNGKESKRLGNIYYYFGYGVCLLDDVRVVDDSTSRLNALIK